MARYLIKCVCRECKKELIRTPELNGDTIIDEWSNIVISSKFAPKCLNGCENENRKDEVNTHTESEVYELGNFIRDEVNTHTELEIYELGNFIGGEPGNINGREARKIELNEVVGTYRGIKTPLETNETENSTKQE